MCRRARQSVRGMDKVEVSRCGRGSRGYGRMGLAEAHRLVPETSFGCGGAECGRVLGEDRGAPSGWIAVVSATGAGAVHSSKTKLGRRLAGPREHELGFDRCCGAMFPSTWSR